MADELAVVVEPSPVARRRRARGPATGGRPRGGAASRRAAARARAAPWSAGRPGRRPPPRAARRGRGPRPAARRPRGGRGDRSSCGPPRNASPNTRHAARWRRVATRIAWRSSGSLPSRVPCLLGEHPREVEAEDLPAGLGDVVVGDDAGRLADTARRVAPVGRRRRRRRPAGPPSVADAVGIGRQRAPSRPPVADGVRRRVAGLRRRLRAGRPSAAASISALVTASTSAAARSVAASSSSSGPIVDLRRRRRVRLRRQRRCPSCPACALRRARSPARADSSLDASAGARPGSAATTASIAASAASSPLTQLDLELDEPLDDPAPGDRVDLVEADLDDRPVALEDPLAAELADRDDLDERRVAALLEDQRAGIGAAASRAGGRSGRPGPRAPRGDGRRRCRRRCGGPIDLTATVVAFAVCRSRAANPARASAPSAVSM